MLYSARLGLKSGSYINLENPATSSIFFFPSHQSQPKMQFSHIVLAATAIASVQAANATNGTSSSSSPGAAAALGVSQGVVGAGLAAAGAVALLL